MTATTTPPRRLLFVHPHPDDEAIACGGVIARYTAAGHDVTVVTCTGGEEGENQAGIDLAGQEMGAVRRVEMADAITALGGPRHIWLGYRDSGMVDTSANGHPDSFHAADLEVASRRLAVIIRQLRPEVVVSDDEHGTYGHPDHVKANRVTDRAIALAADPDADLPGHPTVVAKRYVHTLGRGRVWAGHQAMMAAGMPSPFGDAEISGPEDLPFGTPDELVTTSIDTVGFLEQKQAAMAAHRSQIGPDSFFLNIPPEMAGGMFGLEQFVRLTPPGGARDGEDSLLDGLPPSVPQPDPRSFRRVMGRFVTGVTVMTTVRDGDPHGMTANAVTSVSLDPLLVLVCVARGNHMADEIVASRVFALSILGAEQRSTSDHFANPARPAGAAGFADIPHRSEITGAPVLDDALAWLDCEVWDIHDGGDHLIVVGRVAALGDVRGIDPLVYYGSGGYTRLAIGD